jgi:hypothetical protein
LVSSFCLFFFEVNTLTTLPQLLVGMQYSVLSFGCYGRSWWINWCCRFIVSFLSFPCPSLAGLIHCSSYLHIFSLQSQYTLPNLKNERERCVNPVLRECIPLQCPCPCHLFIWRIIIFGTVYFRSPDLVRLDNISNERLRLLSTSQTHLQKVHAHISNTWNFRKMTNSPFPCSETTAYVSEPARTGSAVFLPILSLQVHSLEDSQRHNCKKL